MRHSDIRFWQATNTDCWGGYVYPDQTCYMEREYLRDEAKGRENYNND